MARSRTTRQYEVLTEAIKNLSSFFDAQELLTEANNTEEISQATTYRFLKQQVQDKHLFEYRCEGSRVFTKQKRSHCHFICEETNKVIHFDVDNIDFLKDKVPGEIRSFQIEVRGVCNTCK